jgi:hypothetical protein
MDESLFAALRLSAEGSGTVREIMETPADQVMHMIFFNRYRVDYENTWTEMNKRKTP